MDNDDAAARGGHIRGTRDAILARQTHFPNRSLKVLHMRFPHPLKAVTLDHVHDPNEAGYDIRGHRVKRGLNGLVQKFDFPYPFASYLFRDESQAVRQEGKMLRFGRAHDQTPERPRPLYIPPSTMLVTPRIGNGNYA